MTLSTGALKSACEDGSFCHDMAFEIAKERDALKRALKTAIHEQGQQFKLREAAKAELAKERETARKLLQALELLLIRYVGLSHAYAKPTYQTDSAHEQDLELALTNARAAITKAKARGEKGSSE
jgi:hypothetical protein